MSNSDERLAARIRSVIDSVGSAVPDPSGSSLPPPARSRSAPHRGWATAAAATLILGAIAVLVARRDDGPAPAAPVTTKSTEATSTNGTTTTTPTTTTAATDSATGVSPLLDLLEIRVVASQAGTTNVVLVFDSDLPSDQVELLANVDTPVADGVGYTTQSGPGILICGDGHGFPAAQHFVDVLIPSNWIRDDAKLEPQIVVEPGSELPAKIATCHPRNGAVEIAIGGSASGRAEDVTVTVSANTITIDIAPERETTIDATA